MTDPDDAYIVMEAGFFCAHDCTLLVQEYQTYPRFVYFKKLYVRVPVYDTTQTIIKSKSYPGNPTEQTILWELYRTFSHKVVCSHLRSIPDDPPEMSCVFAMLFGDKAEDQVKKDIVAAAT